MRIDTDTMIEALEEISRIPELKKAIDNSIERNNFSMKALEEDSPYNYSSRLSDVVNNIRSDCSTLSVLHGVSLDSIDIYVSLDKKVIAKIPFYYRDYYKIKTLVPQGNKNFFLLDGSTFRKAYDDMNSEVISFLSQYKELFPESSKKFIANKNKTINDKPKITLTALRNDFDTRVFANSFPKEPDMKFIRKYLDIFTSEVSKYSSEYGLNLVFFLKALDLKYPKHDNERLLKFEHKVYLQLFKNFDTLTGWHHSNRDDASVFYQILDQILSNEKLLDFFFDKLNNKTSKMARLFARYPKNDRHSEISRLISIAELTNNMISNSLKFENCSSELQELLIKENLTCECDIDFKTINKNIKNKPKQDF